GCNSVIATRAALRLSEYVVTEAGFAADLGAEKFLDIKCRLAGLAPSVAVLVASIRALKMNGGVAKADLGAADAGAVTRGCANLGRHIRNLRDFGLPVVVALNHFDADTGAEIDALRRFCDGQDVPMAIARHWAEGGAGAEDLARQVATLAEGAAPDFRLLYEDDLPLWDKIQTICTRVYGAGRVEAAAGVLDQLEAWQQAGHGDLPVCIAKTQYSFSTDPALRGAPEGHTVPVREVRLNAGAGFVVAICGNIMTMPGLPRHPAAELIRLDRAGRIEGLF
ncbi:formate--tetrahydrofolate ligase, partial [Paracoccus sp. (in: a-proteobacteria)]|uniref:formate--tetrahydrofolate ligase n=1 Tax=Paracoccus sp. TaxID=267 RepID=UPI003A85BBE7